ncbi:hypothetical protein [Parapedobacter tibetensis]|nr:hypothetical protein [Parapedobacter tibetensis]
MYLKRYIDRELANWSEIRGKRLHVEFTFIYAGKERVHGNTHLS